MNELVSCKSCMHARYEWKNFPFNIGSPYSWQCDKVKTKEEIELDPVNGKEILKKAERKLCMSARDKFGDCGPDGKFWEPKNKKDMFKYIKRI